MMRALVTGARGFLGSQMIDRLLSEGHEVIAASRTATESDREGLSWIRYPARVGDWVGALDGVGTVYHFAWSTTPSTSNERPIDDAIENVVPSIALLEALRVQKARLIFASSGGTVYGATSAVKVRENSPTSPISAYGVSKLAVENYVNFYSKVYGVEATCLRISNPYGPGQPGDKSFGAVATFARAALRGEPIKIFGDGTIVRDYLYVDDLITAILLAGKADAPVSTLNIGSGEGTSLNEIIEGLQEFLAQRLVVEYFPQRKFDVPVSILDIELARNSLGWSPLTRFPDGLAKTLEGMQSHRR
ncbi:MAG: NAD-dependent epimerase/dehydratase family protein [Proteobacteria bacterium]|nr:MAG: NAD-dependent epimerase/dehydratase family protein [Pseudomonadota bacterium]